jgi:plastocyanin
MKKKLCGEFSLGVLLSILCLALVGCGGGGGDGGSAVTSSVTVVDCSTVVSAATVTALISTFSPATVTIQVNNVVRWISDSNLLHTVTSGTATSTTATPDGQFNSTLSTKGSTVCLKFAEAGAYNYYCTQHYMFGMTGVVTVTP